MFACCVVFGGILGCVWVCWATRGAMFFARVCLNLLKVLNCSPSAESYWDILIYTSHPPSTC